MAGYTKTYTLDFTATGDTVYTGVDKLEDDIDSIVTWVNKLKESYSSASAPTSPAPDDGQTWWDSTNGEFNVYDGTNWNTLAFHRERNIILMAGSGWPSTTGGCAAVAQVEYGTNDVDLKVMDFDDGQAVADEKAQWTTILPDDYNAGTMTAVFMWTTADGEATQTCCWAIQARAYANDDAIDQAFGDAVSVSDTWIANNDVHVTSATSAMTIGGGPVAGELVQFRVYRDTSEDDLDADCRLIGVKLTYKSVGT